MTDETPEVEESLFQAPEMHEQERMVEAILFATSDPITVAQLNAQCHMAVTRLRH